MFCYAVCMVWGTAASAQVVDDPLVVRLAHERHPDPDVAGANVEVARAAAVSASLYPNPTVSWSREALLGGGSIAEDSIALNVPVDLSGRRRGRAALGRAATLTAEAGRALARSEAAREALLCYVDALEARQRAALLSSSAERLAEAERVVGARLGEGTASGYERSRLVLAAELARDAVALAEAEAESLEVGLAVLLDLDPEALRLAPDGLAYRPLSGGDEAERAARLEPGSRAVDRAKARQRPAVELLKRASQQAHRARDAARSAWLPVISVSGGLRTETTTQTRYGYVAGVSIPLPLLSRGQDLQATARAQQRASEVRRRAAERRAESEVVAARRRLARLEAEIVRLDAAVRDASGSVTRASMSAYREGRRSLLELIDAQRVSLALELRRLGLVAAAKRAQIALRAARGELD